MKKLLSISFALLILLSGMHLTIATHFCGGELSASKVSFSGELASCGMEEPSDRCFSSGHHFDSNCCKNKVSVFSIDNNFAPEFSFFNAFSQPVLQAFAIPENITFHSLESVCQIDTDVSPPGSLLANAVSLPKICVFRI